MRRGACPLLAARCLTCAVRPTVASSGRDARSASSLRAASAAAPRRPAALGGLAQGRGAGTDRGNRVSGVLLEIRDLVVRFPVGGRLLGRLRSRAAGIEAVAGASLRVNEGKTYALVGESGSGKTTLARAVIGLVPVSEGSIAFEGRPIRGMDRQDGVRSIASFR